MCHTAYIISTCEDDANTCNIKYLLNDVVEEEPNYSCKLIVTEHSISMVLLSRVNSWLC